MTSSTRDDLTAIFVADEERNPVKAAQREMKRPLPKKFYTEVAVAPAESGFGLMLDGKPVRTPSRGQLALPTQALAEALAAEWRGQGEHIDPATMPLTRMANTALDGVALQMEQVAAEIAKFAASDLVCYRAGEPETLVAAQNAAWTPVLAFAERVFGARFHLAEGVMFVAQPEDSIAAVARAIDAEAQQPDGAFRLTALHEMTALTGSVLIALALARGAQKFDEGWAAAHVDEDHQLKLWGGDEEAQARRAVRLKDMRAAYELYAALG
ncbi:ATPase [Rhodoblastus sphagnicola]|uniref:ATPase n=1 Tax=Rhodoblastus sphagnicola TaxID=333368 RepID=A0A2S6NCT0_9HYPH|nr:ATP12 family protein [Rhodoblastus sphagnicola]MBB4196264.1 chaperone required for assembly of F1-ATPase [Rhodoblastus sphagnicola]PPQ32409.1 ATPase [Rhodoblastus sphagnicola]